MANYDLTVFSPNEFEEFCRDLLQEKLGVFIESFKTGKDGGIDLRYSKPKSKNVIVQAKRYKNYSSLIINLEKEVYKVRKLNPDKYIITTTVGLSPHNKDKIKTLFTPYIKTTEDILGRDDLLNLLSQNNKVEEKYFKLWITSTAILQKVLHSKIYNQSMFELDEIRDQAKIYVQTPSFYEARNILENHRYIIISGIPGIGKTTLSRMLTLFLLSKGYEEFVYLSDKIDDGYSYFSEGKKQIFLFDDFLGKNFFDAVSLQKNDDKIIKFINKIKSSPDKVLILATREYILNQAKEVYEAFRIHNIEIAKCTIDLSTYASMSKAKILYNHLYHGEIPEEYLDNLLQDHKYSILINHANYSPRIIEAFIKQKIWLKCEPDNFFNILKELFDFPDSVWLHSFENSLDKFSQYTLLILTTLGTPVLLNDLESAVKEFFSKNNLKLLTNYDSIKFVRSIRELENTFIRTTADDHRQIAIEYQNPSIYDFLVKYISDNDSIIEDLIDSFRFVDQFYTIFSGVKTPGKITLKQTIIDRLAEILLKIEPSFLRCRLNKSSTREGLTFTKYKYSNYMFLNYLFNNYSSNEQIKEFIYRQFEPAIQYVLTSDSIEYLNLMQNLDLSRFTFDEEIILDSFFCYSQNIEDLENFKRFNTIFPESYVEWIESSHFLSIADNIITEELQEINGEIVYDYRAKVEMLKDNYPDLDVEVHFETLDKLETQYDNYIEHQIEMAKDSGFRNYNDKASEDRAIHDIFNSLKDR